MKKCSVKHLFASCLGLLLSVCVFAAPDAPTPLVNNGVLPKSVGASCTDSYIAGTTFSSSSAEAGATHYLISDIDFTEPKGQIVLNASFSENFVNGGFHDTKADVYSIVSNPRVLNENFDAKSDNVNRLILGLEKDPYSGPAKVLMTYTVSGLKVGSSVKITYDVEDVTTSVPCACVGGDYMQIVTKAISGKHSALDFVECGELPKATAELIFDNVETGFVSFSIEASQMPIGKVIAFSNFKVYGCLERQIETNIHGNSAYEGDIITFSANGFDDLTGPYTWYSSTNGTSYEVITGETSATLDRMIMLGHNFIKVERDGYSKTIEIVGMVKCALNGDEKYELFREDFGYAAVRRADNSGCITGYTFTKDGKVDDNYYCIVSKMSQASPDACGWPTTGTDHTGNLNGGFLILNCGNNPNKCFYKKQIGKICANVWYDFSLYAANVAVAPNMPGEFRFEIVQVGTGKVLNSCKTGYIKDMAVNGEQLKWNNYGFSFMTESDMEVELRLYTTGTETQGNDVAIDDMVLSVCQTDLALYADRNNKLFDADFSCGENVPMGLVTEGDIERIYSTPYLLWQISNNQKTWTTLTEGGMEKLTFDYTKDCERAKYVRVIATGSKEDAYKVAAGEPLGECDSYVISNVAKLGCTDCPDEKVLVSVSRSCNDITLSAEWSDETETIVWQESTDGVSWNTMDQKGSEVKINITENKIIKAYVEEVGASSESMEESVNYEAIALNLSESSIGIGAELVGNVDFTSIDPLTDVQWFVDGKSVDTAPAPYSFTSLYVDCEIKAIADGCESVANVEVKWPTIFMPTSEKNKDFLVGYNIPLKIYDRYGDIVVETDNGWNGLIHGKNAAPAVYFYVATFDEGKQRKGSIELYK